MAFADLMANLHLNIAPFTHAMNQARQQTQRFSTQVAANVAANGHFADRLIHGYRSLDEQLHKVGLGMRDVARIAAGITISQTFYGITRSINEATDALWEFNKSLDYAHVTYGALFGSSNLASEFIETLKQFSIDTIFEYSDIEGMARKLSAYGIEYKNLMFIIEGLTNIGTISGDTAALERLAVAIGQINAKGKLTAEEMRQLANAYTPIYDILRDKLGLSESELGMVGDLGISSADAINAIIEYANETFGATADAAVLTITGLNNKVVDSLKVLGSAIISPLTTFYKSFVKYFADSLAEVTKIYEASGLGGVFEHLVPDEAWQHRIRSFIAAIKNMISTVAATIMTLWPYIRQFLGGLIDGFTLFIGILNSAMSALVGFLQSVGANTGALRVLTSALVMAAGAWLLFKIQALGAAAISVLKVIFVDVAKAALYLVTVLTKHPLIAGLTVLGAVLLGVASNARNTKSAVSDLLNAFNSMSIGGDTADDILQTEDALNKGADASDKFWESMEDGAKDTEDAVDGAGNAAKKASKSLLSFDEVFRLNENDAGSGLGSGVLDGIGDLSDALGGLGSALIPEIPDLSSFATDFVSSLYDNLWNAIKTIASGGATGALIGGLIGFTIGGFVTKTMSGALSGASLGAKIGGIAGAGFAGFWTDTYKEMEASLQKIAVGGAAGMLVAGLVGMIVGAFSTRTLDGAIAGAKMFLHLGSLIGMGLGSFWAVATEEMSNAVEGILVGGAAGAFAGGLVGLIIGAFIGAPGQRLKSALTGARLGSAIGGGLGAALAGFWGNASDEMKNSIENAFNGFKAASYGAFFGGLLGMVVGAIVGAFVGGQVIAFAKAGAVLGTGIGTLVGMIGAKLYEYLSDAGIVEYIGAWFGDTFNGIKLSIDGIMNGVASVFGDLLESVVPLLSTIYNDLLVPLFKICKNVFDALMEIHLAIGPLIDTLLTLIFDVLEVLVPILGTLVNGKLKPLLDVIALIVDVLVNRVVAVLNPLITLVVDLIEIALKPLTLLLKGDVIGAFEALATRGISVTEAFGKFFGSMSDNLTEWVKDTVKKLLGWSDESHGVFVDFFNTTLKKFGEWTGEALNNIKDWATDSFNEIGTFVGDSAVSISTWVVDTLSNFSTWAGNAFLTISGWVTDTSLKVGSWASETKEKIKSWTFDTGLSFVEWSSNTTAIIYSWVSLTAVKINSWISDTVSKISDWSSKTYKTIYDWVNNGKAKLYEWVNTTIASIVNWSSNTATKLSNWYTKTADGMSTWVSNTKKSLKNWWDNLWNPSTWKAGWDLIKSWFTDLFNDIKNWFTGLGNNVSSWWDGLWDDKEVKVTSSTGSTGSNRGGAFKLSGHASGGIFNREHIARFAEGDRAEAVIPLENNSAMQPFVSAISDGILQGLLPAMSVAGNSNNLPPMYVGTLIADERGLQQLYKKFELYEAKELARKGLL